MPERSLQGDMGASVSGAEERAQGSLAWRLAILPMAGGVETS